MSHQDILIRKHKGLCPKVVCLPVFHFVPLHTSPYGKKYLGYKKGDFPVAEKAASEVLSLPVCAELKREEVEQVWRAGR